MNPSAKWTIFDFCEHLKYDKYVIFDRSNDKDEVAEHLLSHVRFADSSVTRGLQCLMENIIFLFSPHPSTLMNY